jgi:hypothetical protein
MTLQSQAPRPTTIRGAASEKGLGKANILVFSTLGLAGAIVAGLLLYQAIANKPGPQSALASAAGTTDPLATNTANPGTPASSITPPPAPQPKPPVTELQMGQNPADKPLVPPPGTTPSITPNTAPGSGPSTNPGTAPASTPPASPSTSPAGTPAASPGTTPANPPRPAPGSAPKDLGNPGANPASENPTAPNIPQANPGSGPLPATGNPIPTGGSNAPPPPPSATPNEVRDLVDAAQRAISQGRTVEGRTLLNKALFNDKLPSEERRALRSQIAALNDTLLFGAGVASGDPLCDTYAIAPGDSLATLVRKQSLPVDWRFIQRINGIKRPEALRVGQRVKVVRQPFHAVVHKNDFRLDLYAGDPVPNAAGRKLGPDGQDESWTFIKSFKVGLGESNGTPEGSFVVRANSKLVNPRWVNPRTGQQFDANDPKNPIGEHWIGLEGVDDNTRKFQGYGIHGTIEPESIGRAMSMGCVRMNADDVALVYEVLLDRISTVRILP